MKKSILIAAIAALTASAAFAECSDQDRSEVKLDNGFAEMLKDQSAQFPAAQRVPHATQGGSYTPAK